MSTERSIEERLSDLEHQFAEQHRFLCQALDGLQYMGGSQRAYEAAVLALIEAHPDKSALAGPLEMLQAKLAGPMLAEAKSEHHIQGMLAAQELIQLAFSHRNPV